MSNMQYNTSYTEWNDFKVHTMKDETKGFSSLGQSVMF